MNPMPRLIVVLLACWLVSCGSSPPVRYYSLEPTQAPVSDQEDGAIVVGLGPLRVPEYLRRTQMVTRDSGTQVEVNDYVRWAEPVDKAIHRVVAADVDRRLDGVVVMAFPYFEAVPIDYVVLGSVEQFEADSAGTVELQVQWAVLDKEKSTLLPPRRTHYETRVVSAGDPGAIARAMTEALNRFSEDLASQLRKALQGAPPAE